MDSIFLLACALLFDDRTAKMVRKPSFQPFHRLNHPLNTQCWFLQFLENDLLEKQKACTHNYRRPERYGITFWYLRLRTLNSF